MAGPWEKYAAPAAAAGDGPWSKYTAPAAPSGASAIPGYQAPALTAQQQAAALANEQGLRQAGRTTSEDNLLGKVIGPFDAAATIGTGMVAGLAAPIVGFGKALLNPGSAKQPDEYAAEFASNNTWTPRTGTGQQLATMVGKAAEPLGALPTATLAQGAQAIGSGSAALRGLAGSNAAAMAAQDAQAAAGAGKLSDLLRAQQPAMAGVGAAATDAAAIRAQRFNDFGIKPTQGQLDRTFQQIKFEREAAKTKEGGAINDRYAEQNAQMARALDDFTDQTGAQASGLRAAGKAVVDAAGSKKTVKKQEINAAYNKAKEAGDMAEQVDVSPIAKFVEDNRSAMKNAPILDAIESEVNRLSGGTGKMSVNDLEELRKMTGRLAQPGTPNAVYGKDAIRMIDQSTDGKGGPLYQQARRLNENFRNEFTDRDVVDKLLRNNPGTKDRAVAYEDVMKHTLLNGSLDDTRHVFRVLEAYPKGTAPEVVEAGQQAARELRGALINHLKETVFSNAGADTAGNAVGSAAKFQRLVRELDKDGKLEAILGKQGAQKVRDAQELATDLYTSPTGTVNSSNNATAIVKALDRISGLPYVGGIAKYAAKHVESRELSKKVDAALNPPGKLSDMTGVR